MNCQTVGAAKKWHLAELLMTFNERRALMIREKLANNRLVALTSILEFTFGAATENRRFEPGRRFFILKTS